MREEWKSRGRANKSIQKILGVHPPKMPQQRKNTGRKLAIRHSKFSRLSLAAENVPEVHFGDTFEDCGALHRVWDQFPSNVFKYAIIRML
jgi:hypothetical protein